MQSPPFPRYLFPPRSKYSPQHHILKHPQLPFLPQCQRQSFTPIQNNRKNYSSIYLNVLYSDKNVYFIRWIEMSVRVAGWLCGYFVFLYFMFMAYLPTLSIDGIIYQGWPIARPWWHSRWGAVLQIGRSLVRFEQQVRYIQLQRWLGCPHISLEDNPPSPYPGLTKAGGDTT